MDNIMTIVEQIHRLREAIEVLALGEHKTEKEQLQVMQKIAAIARTIQVYKDMAKGK